VDARGRSATTMKERYDGAVLLADANMKAALGVNDLESSGEGVEDSRTKNGMEDRWRISLFTCATLLVQPRIALCRSYALTYHCSLVHLSFAGQSRLHLLSKLHGEEEEHIERLRLAPVNTDGRLPNARVTILISTASSLLRGMKPLLNRVLLLEYTRIDSRP
jgi:hypothetical protein